MRVRAILPNGIERPWDCDNPKIGMIITTIYYPDMLTLYKFEIVEMSEDKTMIWVEIVGT